MQERGVAVQDPKGLLGVGLSKQCLDACLEGVRRAAAILSETPKVEVGFRGISMCLAIDGARWMDVVYPRPDASFPIYYGSISVTPQVGRKEGKPKSVWQRDIREGEGVEAELLDSVRYYAFACAVSSFLRSRLRKPLEDIFSDVVAGGISPMHGTDVGVGVFPGATLVGEKKKPSLQSGGLALCFSPASEKKWKLALIAPIGERGDLEPIVLAEGDCSDAESLKGAVEHFLPMALHFGRATEIVYPIFRMLTRKAEVGERRRLVRTLIGALPDKQKFEALAKAVYLCLRSQGFDAQ